MTSIPDPNPCDIAELRTLFLFEKLDDEKLDWLAGVATRSWSSRGSCTPRANRRPASTSCSTGRW